jgi:ribosomal protein S7
MRRQQFLAIKWLTQAARARKGHGMHNNLAAEILEAYNNQVCKTGPIHEWTYHLEAFFMIQASRV